MYKQQILKNLSWLSLQDIPTQLLGIVFFTFLGRYLGETGIGSYSYVFSVLAIVGLVIDFGLNNHFWRRWSADSELIAADESLYINSKALALIIATIPFVVYIVLFDYGLWSYFVIAFAYTVFDVVRSLPILSFQSTNNFQHAFYSNMTDRLIGFGSAIVLLYLGYSLHIVLVAFLIARAFAIFVAYYFYGHLPHVVPSFSQAKNLLMQNKQIFLISIFSYLYFKVDVIVMRRVLSVDAVGMYSSAYRVLDTLTMIPNLVLFAIFPSLAHMAHRNDDASSSSVVQIAIKYLTVVALFAAITCQFYAKEILSFLYHNEFLPAAPTLAVLGWTAIVMFATVPLVYVHLAKKNDSMLLQRLVALTIFNIGLNILLLPIVGIIGAAYATLVTEIVSAIILLRFSSVQWNLDWVIKLSVVGVGFIVLYRLFHPALFLMTVGAGLSYCLLLYLLRVVNVEDFKG